MVKRSTQHKRIALQTNRERARSMRREPVSMEKQFWHRVRDRRFFGFKFKRQYLIGRYIADFVCLEAKLVVELDGPHHSHQQSYDLKRDATLREQGFRILRLRNEDLSEATMQIVLLALRSPSP